MVSCVCEQDKNFEKCNFENSVVNCVVPKLIAILYIFIYAYMYTLLS